jgi:hypothetical protein
MEYIQEELKKSFYEIDEILKNIPEEFNQKLPEKIKKVIKENKTNNGFSFNKYKRLDNQKMLHNTKIILSIFYRMYWCSNDQRIKLEQEDDLILSAKYNVDNIFKKNKNTEYTNVKETRMIKYKKNVLERIIDRIQKFFKRK